MDESEPIDWRNVNKQTKSITGDWQNTCFKNLCTRKFIEHLLGAGRRKREAHLFTLA